ncbi:MAG: hypothetical protein K8T20_02380 [Planctomycetes bacterium]|nr:hypothetical protein [Planctomycetota bacterium]
MSRISTTLGMCLFLAGLAGAETLEDRVKSLETKMKVKEDSEGAAPEPGSPAAAGSNKIDAYFKNGLQVKSQDGNFEMHVGGRVLVHYRAYFMNPERISINSFSFREVKIDLQGKIFKDWGFRVEAASTGPNFSIDDAYVSFERFSCLKIKVGQYKAPMSIDQTQSTLFIDMPERGLLDRLVPGYELGAMVYGEIVEKIFAYNVMVSNGTGRAGVDNNSDKDIFLRAQLRPFATMESDFLKGIHIAVDANYGKRGLATGVLPYTYSDPASQTTFVAKGPNANFARFDGSRYRVNTELAWLLGPIGVKAQFLWTRDSYRFPGSTTKTGRGANANHSAWLVTASWIITGEAKTWDRPTVNKPLFGSAGGIGAVEVLARYSRFNVPGDLIRDGIISKQDSAQKVDEFAAGVNWYPNPNVRVSAMYAFIEYTGSSIRPLVVGNRRFDHEDVLVIRVQVDF